MTTFIEPNDTLTTATTTGINGIGNAFFTGAIGDNPNITSGLDVDLFEVQVNAGDLLTVDIDAEVIGSDLDSYLRLFDASGSELASNDDSDGFDSALTYIAPTSEIYYVGVSSVVNTDYDPTLEGSGNEVDEAGEYNITLDVLPIEEFQVNTFTTEGQDDAEIAIDADGDFIIVWESYEQDGDDSGIYAQRYNADGTRNGNEFRVNTTTVGGQYDGRVAFDAAGNFVISWQNDDEFNDSNIYAQRYNADGTPNGSEFQVNTTIIGDQIDPRVSVDATGNFVIVWQSSDEFDDDSDIYAQRYNADGTPNGGEFLVNTTTDSFQEDPTVAMAPDGTFVVAWEGGDTFSDDDDEDNIFAQRYNADGTPNGSEFQVNTFTTGSQDTPHVAINSNGQFVMTWESNNPSDDNDQDGDSTGVFAQRYNADGTPDGDEFQVNTFTTGNQDDPQAAIDADGNVVITWESRGDQDGDGDGIYVQRYNADGTPDGGEVQVNTFTIGDQDDPAVAFTPDGDFIITWESGDNDEEEEVNDIFARQFSVSAPSPFTAFVDENGILQGDVFGAGELYTGEMFSNTDTTANPDDIMQGTPGDDKIWAGELGNDMIDAGEGNNEIGIGTGDSNVTAGSGDDFVYSIAGGGGTNILDLGEGNNKTWLESGDYEITTGSGDDEIGLGDGTDIVDAGDGNNTVYMVDPNGVADGNKDVLTGIGNDWVQTGSGNDRLDLGTNAGGDADYDIAFGQGGMDTFVLNIGSGFLTVGDFTQGEDIMEITTDFANIGSSFDAGRNSTWVWDNDSTDVLAELQGFSGTLATTDFVPAV